MRTENLTEEERDALDPSAIERIALDQQELENAERASLDEPGSYIAQDGMEVEPYFDDRDGRMMYQVRGFGVNEQGRRTRIFSRISPQFRAREEPGGLIPRPDAPDFKHGLWVQACRAYKTALGEYPKEAQQVSDYLRRYPVRYVLARGRANGDRGPSMLLVGIKPVTGAR